MLICFLHLFCNSSMYIVYLCLFFLWTVYTINTYLMNLLYSYVFVTSHFKKLVSPLAEHWLSVSFSPTIKLWFVKLVDDHTTRFRRISSGKLTGVAVWESLKLHNDLFINIIYYYRGSWCLRTILCVCLVSKTLTTLLATWS